ncbi:MAG: hypothetical protein WDN67_03175 [Candidatus Moraniibacteriota bacterium]
MENAKRWGIGSYILTAIFVFVFLSQTGGLLGAVVGLIGGILSGLMLYPLAGSLPRFIASSFIRSLISGFILWALIGTVCILILILLQIQ